MRSTSGACLLVAASTLFVSAVNPTAFLSTAEAAPISAVNIPEPTQARYPGVLKLSVDVTDVERKIHRAKISIPVVAGPLTLLFPQWLPGNHSPNGNIGALSGLVITANGQTLTWTRDTINVFAFHITVPTGVISRTRNCPPSTAISAACRLRFSRVAPATCSCPTQCEPIANCAAPG